MRLFVALCIGEKEKNVLEQYIIKLKKTGVSGNFSRKENLHFTLAFIGETDDIDAAVRAMKATVTEPFAFHLSAPGRFKNGDGGGDTAFLAVDNDVVMRKLTDLLAENLKKEGFRLENRSFKAHLTLGRGVMGYEKIRDISAPDIEISAKEMTLMKSERIRGILTYTPVFSKEL